MLTGIIFRYIQKFYSMRTQLQAISLRIQVRGLLQVLSRSSILIMDMTRRSGVMSK